jgi:hypothetical protein
MKRLIIKPTCAGATRSAAPVAVRAGRLMSMPKDGRATRKLIRKVKAIEAGGMCTSRISYGWAIQRAQNAPKSTIGIEHPGWRRSTMMTRDAAQSIGAS